MRRSNWVSALALSFAINFAFSFVLSERKGKLVHSLVPIAHSLQDRDRRSMYQREEQLRPIRLPRKK